MEYVPIKTIRMNLFPASQVLEDNADRNDYEYIEKLVIEKGFVRRKKNI